MGVLYDSRISEYNIFINYGNEMRKQFHLINEVKKQKIINVGNFLAESQKAFRFDPKSYKDLNLVNFKSIQSLSCKHFVPTI